MAIDYKIEKEKLILAEERRLRRIFSKIEKKKKATIDGLIQRAAFMRISLDELEQDINICGLTELFQQGDQEPYKRKRPEADLYNTMNTGYQKIIKQLTDLLPKEEAAKVDDGFNNFANGREEI